MANVLNRFAQPENPDIRDNNFYVDGTIHFGTHDFQGQEVGDILTEIPDPIILKNLLAMNNYEVVDESSAPAITVNTMTFLDTTGGVGFSKQLTVPEQGVRKFIKTIGSLTAPVTINGINGARFFDSSSLVTSLTFTALGQYVELIRYNSTDWFVVLNNGVTL